MSRYIRMAGILFMLFAMLGCSCANIALPVGCSQNGDVSQVVTFNDDSAGEFWGAVAVIVVLIVIVIGLLAMLNGGIGGRPA